MNTIKIEIRWSHPADAVPAARALQYTIALPVTDETALVGDGATLPDSDRAVILAAALGVPVANTRGIDLDLGVSDQPPTPDKIVEALHVEASKRSGDIEAERKQKEVAKAEAATRFRAIALKRLAELRTGKQSYNDRGDYRYWQRVRDQMTDEEKVEMDVLERGLAENKRIAEDRQAAEKEAVEKEAEAQKAAEISDWTASHGSERLRMQLQQGMDGWPLYLHERLEHEIPGAELDNDGENEDIASPTVDAMAMANKLRDLLVLCDKGSPEEVIQGISPKLVRMSFDDECNDINEHDPVYACYDGWQPGSAFKGYRVRMRVEATT